MRFALRGISLAVAIVGASFGVLGCAEDNTKNMGGAGGAADLGAPTAATKKPTNNDDYQKQFQGIDPMKTAKNYRRN